MNPFTKRVGCVDGHYEGALTEFHMIFGKVQKLNRDVGCNATIAYQKHIQHLYLRKLDDILRGFKYGESFYATHRRLIEGFT